jgi:hypothetical protein
MGQKKDALCYAIRMALHTEKARLLCMQQTARNKEMPSNCKTNREFI